MTEISNTSEEKLKEPFPPGARNAFYFEFFNTISFSCVVGLPIILFFKELGANATILGVVGSLAPFLIILQIPASRHVEVIGYRRFVVNGWLIRTFFILGLIGTALLPSKIDAFSRMFIAFFFLLGYNISRGISTCGFMPWITCLIPDAVRGRFLATMQMTASLASLLNVLGCSWWLSHHPGVFGYACIFTWAATAAAASLYFLNRIPDVPVPAESKSREPIPWKELLSYGPFIKIISMNIIFLTALAGGGLFWVPLLRDQFGKDSSYVLNVMAASTTFAFFVQYGASRLIDRTGSKPALSFGILAAAVHFALWGCVAAHLIPLSLTSLFFVQLTAALSFPLFNLANTRLVMSIVPSMARSHYFAVFNVACNLTLGFFPWIWGLGVDGLKGWDIVTLGTWHWNAYSLFYMALVVIVLISWVLLLRIHEPKAITTEEFIQQLFVETPKRAITRLISRRVTPS